jgi:CBS domain-containing protein
MNVAAILNAKGPKVITAAATTTVQEIAALLASKRIGAIVVTGADGSVEGIVSERDIVGAVGRLGAACLDHAVATVMTRHVVTCTPTESLDQLFATMTEGRFRHVPVVDAGRLVGIVSIGDAVKNHIAEVEQEATLLKSYVLA